jgi:hypothetical protein
MWLEHLTTRKRGAAKAAPTRRKRAAAIRVNQPQSTSDPTGPSVPSTSHSLAQAPGPHSLAQAPGPHSLAQALVLLLLILWPKPLVPPFRPKPLVLLHLSVS